MGIFDFITGGKGGNVKKTVEKANNKHAQSIDRFKALENLAEDGSEEALLGLLRRFSFTYDKSIEDEQEKQWVHDALVDLANEHVKASVPAAEQDKERERVKQQKETVLRALERSLLGAETISWQLKVLEHIASHDEVWPILEKVIAANDNEYVRDPSRKIQLIDFLGEWHDPRAARALLQYLEDVDEGVRFKAVESVLHQKDEEIGREPLLNLLVKPDEESRRIKIRILDGLADAGWNTHGFKGTVEKLCETLATGHGIDNKGRIRRPPGKA
jgi:hypothetical protein